MSARRPFKLYQRTLKSGKRVFYARYLKPDGSYTAGRSTGETQRRRAEAAAWKILSNGRITSRQNVKLGRYAVDFFAWDGEWALSKRSAGLRISENQCNANQALTDNHIIEKIGNLHLSEVDTGTVKAFRNRLYREKYAGSTINKALACLKAILEQAEQDNLLRAMPRVQRAGLNQAERGILSPAEVTGLFSLEWPDRRAYVGNLIAAATGFRLGEVLGIKRLNVGADHIEITGTWDTRARRYKAGTKNLQPSRRVPIPGSVAAAISVLMAESPFTEPEAYLLYSTIPDKPVEDRILTQGFRDALARLDPPIDEAIRKERNITFHSHRHFFNSLLVESRIPLQKIQRLTGHLTPEMTQRYYHTDDLGDVAEATGQVFGKILKFGDA